MTVNVRARKGYIKTMKVHELIKKLQTIDPNRPVLVRCEGEERELKVDDIFVSEGDDCGYFDNDEGEYIEDQPHVSFTAWD